MECPQTGPLGRLGKITSFMALILAFVLTGYFTHLFTRDTVKRRRRFTRTVHFFSKLVLKVFNVRVNVKNEPPANQNHLIIANHLGFLDDFIIAATRPTMFVTSVRLRETPVFGQVSEFGGCVYVETRDRANIENEMKDIESALNQGFDVTLYPEAKTTNGEMVHPIKKTLLMSCARTPVSLLPTVLNFRSVNGLPMQHKVRDLVFWYSELPILKVLWNVAAIRDCVVDLEFLQEVEVTPKSDRRDIAAMAQKQLDENYVQIPVPMQPEIQL